MVEVHGGKKIRKNKRLSNNYGSLNLILHEWGSRFALPSFPPSSLEPKLGHGRSFQRFTDVAFAKGQRCQIGGKVANWATFLKLLAAKNGLWWVATTYNSR